jgi:hypothetical protein
VYHALCAAQTDHTLLTNVRQYLADEKNIKNLYHLEKGPFRKKTRARAKKRRKA